MGQAIRNLLALQEVDLRVISLNDEKSKFLDLINQKKSELERRRREFDEREAQRKQLKLGIKKLDGELAEASEHIRKLESQQINVKTNQEYKALNKEIYEAKARKVRIEDTLLQKMGLQEEEKFGIKEGSAQLNAHAAQLERENTETEEKLGEIDRGLVALQGKRSEVASGIEDTLLKLYDRIFKSKNPVIVPVVNRTCQGCHLAVPAGVESVLRRHQSQIVTCENCSRILYVPEEEAE